MTGDGSGRRRHCNARALSLGTSRAPGTPGSLHEQLTHDGHLASWCKVAAGGDERLFRRRLEWEGVSVVGLTADPSWVNTLRAILVGAPPGVHTVEGLATNPLRAVVALTSGLPGTQACNPRAPLPFEDVWIPVLEVARHRLVQRLAHAEPDQVSVGTRRDGGGVT